MKVIKNNSKWVPSQFTELPPNPASWSKLKKVNLKKLLKFKLFINYKFLKKIARVLFGLQDKFFNKSKKTSDPFKPFPNGVNPKTGEVGGPTGPEPTRYGDWERRGRCSDF